MTKHSTGIADRPAQVASADKQGAPAAVGSLSKKPTEHLWLLLVLGVGILGYLPWLGSFGPTDPTDSFFIESGREMVETGKYLLPLNNYEPWLDKPVLFFWLVAGAYKLFGISPFVARLPVALSAVLLGAVMFKASAARLTRKTAALAAVIFLCLPLSSIVGHVCLTDMTLTMLMSGTILYLHRALHSGKSTDLWIGYLFNAFGLLCKGPIASIIPAAVLLLYLFVSHRSFSKVLQGVKQLRPLLGLAVAAAVNVPWYTAASIATDGKFIEAFFWQQNFGRMMGTVNHQMPWWFYIPVFFGGFFPWCALVVSAPAYFKKAIAKRSEDRSGAGGKDMFLLCLCWFVTVMGLFSAIKTKLPTYILPAAPAFAIMVAMQCRLLMRKPGKHLLAVMLVTLVGLIIAVCIQPVLPVYLRHFIFDNWFAAAGVMVSLVCSALLQVRRKAGAAMVFLCAAMTVACGVFVPRGLRAFHDHRQVGFNSLVGLARDANATVGILSAEEPMMPYILHKPVYRLQTGEAAARFLKAGAAPHYLLVPKEMVARLDWFPNGHRIVAMKGKWHLYEVFSSNKQQQ